MVDEQEIVKRKIESGEYFTEGMSWFHEKFTRPRTEFSYFFIICVIAMIAFLWGVLAFSEIFPLSPGKNFIVGRPLGPREHMTIKSIQKPGDTANDAIMKFMLSEYVSARAEYIEGRLDRNNRIIKKFSDDTVYDQYLDEASVNNPQNPVILYGKQASISVTINDIDLVNGIGKPAHDADVTHAIVNYTTTLTYASDNHQETSQHEADITFKFVQITVDQKTGLIAQKPDMKISSYKINSIQPKKTK